MSAININKSNFQNEVMNSDKPVLLDFWAPWCGPCRMVVPIVEQIAEDRKDIVVGKVNVDEQPELASQFGVMSIPTLVVLKGGKETARMVGYRPKEEILELLERYGVELCCYGHLHGGSRRLALEGRIGGVEYRLLSADHVDFTPVKLMDGENSL